MQLASEVIISDLIPAYSDVGREGVARDCGHSWKCVIQPGRPDSGRRRQAGGSFSPQPAHYQPDLTLFAHWFLRHYQHQSLVQLLPHSLFDTPQPAHVTQNADGRKFSIASCKIRFQYTAVFFWGVRLLSTTGEIKPNILMHYLY